MKRRVWYGLAVLMAVFVAVPTAVAITQLTQTFPIMLVQNPNYRTNYGDPPQFARPYKEWANTGFTATGASNSTNAVNEQTPDCLSLFCSYTAGGPSSSITFNLSALQLPAIYDVETQSFNQTLWTTATLSGPSTSKQLRGSVNLCSDGTLLTSITILLPKTYLTFFVRVPANLTNYLDDVCVTYIPFLLAAGDTIRIAWVAFMVPPATVDSVVTVSFNPMTWMMILFIFLIISTTVLGFKFHPIAFMFDGLILIMLGLAIFLYLDPSDTIDITIKVFMLIVFMGLGLFVMFLGMMNVSNKR